MEKRLKELETDLKLQKAKIQVLENGVEYKKDLTVGHPQILSGPLK